MNMTTLLIMSCSIGYFGIGVLIYIATQAHDEHKWNFFRRAKFILGWFLYALWIFFFGIPKKYRKEPPQ